MIWEESAVLVEAGLYLRRRPKLQALVISLVERATVCWARAHDAKQAMQDARDYLRLLVQRKTATRIELRRAARTVRIWRAQSSWLAVTALTLNERARFLSSSASGAL
jgi:hypothetical protein